MSRKTCADCIHCQMCRWIDDMVKNSTCDFFKDWKELEKRPHGEWGEWNEDKGYPCSNCGEYLPYSEEYDYQTNFCPNCGADMRKKEGDEK